MSNFNLEMTFEKILTEFVHFLLRNLIIKNRFLDYFHFNDDSLNFC